MLLATSDSAVAKKPRLRLSMRRSSSLSPSSDFHRAMYACIATSLGIQWLLQPARYFSHAQVYLSGRSWLTSARALIIALSSTSTRSASRSISPSPVPVSTVFGVLMRWCFPILGWGLRAGVRRGPSLASFTLAVVDRAGLVLVDFELVLGRGGTRGGTRRGRGARGRRGAR